MRKKDVYVSGFVTTNRVIESRLFHGPVDYGNRTPIHFRPGMVGRVVAVDVPYVTGPNKSFCNVDFRVLAFPQWGYRVALDYADIEPFVNKMIVDPRHDHGPMNDILMNDILIGRYSRFGYGIYHHGEPIYTAGNSMFDSQGYIDPNGPHGDHVYETSDLEAACTQTLQEECLSRDIAAWEVFYTKDLLREAHSTGYVW